MMCTITKAEPGRTPEPPPPLEKGQKVYLGKENGTVLLVKTRVSAVRLRGPNPFRTSRLGTRN